MMKHNMITRVTLPTFIKTATMFLIVLASTLFAPHTAAADSPNIILILTDDQGWSQRSGLMDPENPETGSNYLRTPAMDRIAEEGMRFTGGYSPAPLCILTRRSILCGTSAARSGSEFVSKWVPAEHMTLPRALKRANPEYQCAHFGKWGEKMISSPEECGYDVSDGHTGNVTGGMAEKMQPAHIVEDPKRTAVAIDQSQHSMLRGLELSGRAIGVARAVGDVENSIYVKAHMNGPPHQWRRGDPLQLIPL